ncbi:N-acetylneuraminate lyase, partial [Staphylococcus pseudintermedius]
VRAPLEPLTEEDKIIAQQAADMIVATRQQFLAS